MVGSLRQVITPLILRTGFSSIILRPVSNIGVHSSRHDTDLVLNKNIHGQCEQNEQDWSNR